MRLLAQVDRIEEAAAERMERNPHAGETKDVALVMMLFEAARLTSEPADDPSAETRRRHRYELTDARRLITRPPGQGAARGPGASRRPPAPRSPPRPRPRTARR